MFCEILLFYYSCPARYLFQLFIGLDANFCLKSRLWCQNKLKKDHPLYKGLGYQVPQKAYFMHLKKYIKEDDVYHYCLCSLFLAYIILQVSTCIAFAALMEKETKLSMGLRCMGVGGCVCT